jgi:hypothetical protein
MISPSPSASSWPTKVRAALRQVLNLPHGSREFEIALADLLFNLSQHAAAAGYDAGLKEGRIRGRRRAKGLPEIAKPRGRPKSVARLLREAGLTWRDFEL